MAKKATRKTTRTTRSADRLNGNPSRRAKPAKPDPRPMATVPPAPRSLGKEGAELWQRLAGQLVELRLLTPLDLEALHVLCDAWDTYRRLESYMDPDRMFVETDKGYIMEHPGVRQRANAAATCDRLWKRFGLTPLDREKLEVDMAPDNAASVEAFARRR